MVFSLKNSRGLTLTELLVALVLSAVIIAAVYRTFIGQQKTYTVQEQVVDMQQNARLSISRMMKEIRMAGYGNVNMILPGAAFGSRTLNNVFTVGNPTGGLTVITVGAATTLAEDPSPDSDQIKVTSLPKDSQGNDLFKAGAYVSVGGLEAFKILSVNTGNQTLTLDTSGGNSVSQGQKQYDPVHAVLAVSYQVVDNKLQRDENLGAGPEDMVDNITDLQFEYMDWEGNPIADPVANAQNIRVVRVSVTARTSQSDPDYKDGEGFRTRTITSNIKVRNMGLTI